MPKWRGEMVQGAKGGVAGFYESIGIEPVINAAGTLTRLGGQRMAPDVLAAMAEASASFVHSDGLQAATGR